MRGKIANTIFFRGVLPAFVLLLFIGCSKTESVSDKVTVTLTSANREDNKVSIKGLFNIWERSELNAKDREGVIHIEKRTKVPELLYLSTPTSIENLWCYLEPGDSLNIHVGDDGAVFTGHSIAVEQNILLQQIKKERAKIWENRNNQVINNRSKKSVTIIKKPVVPTYNDIDERTAQFIADFKKRVPNHSAAFMRFVEIDQKYYRIQNEIGLKIRQTQTYEKYSENELKLLEETLVDSNIDEAIYSGYYRRVLNAYIDYLRIHDPKQLLGNGKEYILNEIRLADYVENQFVKDYIVTGNLYSLVFQEGSNPEYIEAIENYGGQWKEFLLEQVQSAEGNAEYSATEWNEFPEFQAVNVHGDSIRLSDYHGKWIYLEIWTTWSGPSNLEVPYFDELEDRLQDYPVEFIRVSVDNVDDQQKWTNYVQKYKPKGTHLFCAKKQKLYSELGVTAVPHFSIINPEGKLVYNNVLRPSSGIPERLLKALVSE
ncbi:TlpA disulfide reductase family protein [Draconibacterium sp. IB214405]|uniref:TlpA family protein disulfide reductase n=1 Tax=Draconibacterium sp. IB214405 TaxID=3097352 RepID=UPI002A0D27E8|nr:TlpA disulfide reductase family protein [Draconibacterium sp. IB214405]MDX8340287.1 TlpA disulfide reductase family protein [Draconibacterium sp. IB214405]